MPKCLAEKKFHVWCAHHGDALVENEHYDDWFQCADLSGFYCPGVRRLAEEKWAANPNPPPGAQIEDLIDAESDQCDFRVSPVGRDDLNVFDLLREEPCRPSPDAPPRYVDMAAVFLGAHAYTDFEGMTSGEGIAEMIDKVIPESSFKYEGGPARRAVLRTLLFHAAYTVADQCGEEELQEWVKDMLPEVAAVLENLIGSRWFLKEDAK